MYIVTVSCFFLKAPAFLIKHGTNNKFSMHGNGKAKCSTALKFAKKLKRDIND